MGRSKKYGRRVNGVLMLNKPSGITSNTALQRAKRLFFANKAGHTGALDPMATGVLPLCFGEATKFSQHLLDADKGYKSTFKLGVATSTADAEGEELTRVDASHLSMAQIEPALQNLRGAIAQVPPMVSALKHNGQPLYKLARQGIEIERPPRNVHIYKLEVQDFRPGAIAELDVEIECSKGTYVRSLASDLGDALEVGGHVAKLHRHLCGRFSDQNCLSLEQIEAERGDAEAEVLDHLLKPVDALIDELPLIDIDANSSHYFCRGQGIMDLRVYRLGKQGDTVRVCHENGQFLGLGEITDDGRVAPKRLVVFDQ